MDLQDTAVDVLFRSLEVEKLSENAKDSPGRTYDLALKINNLSKTYIALVAHQKLIGEDNLAMMHEEEIISYALRCEGLCQRILSSKYVGRELAAKTLLLQADIMYYFFGSTEGAGINIRKVKSMYAPSDRLYLKAQGLENYINYHSNRNVLNFK